MMLKLTAVMASLAVLAVAVAEPGIGHHGHGGGGYGNDLGHGHGGHGHGGHGHGGHGHGGIGHGHGGHGHGGIGHGHGGYGHDVHHHSPAAYSFKYGVQDDYKGVNFGHEEHRDGYNTKGAYYVHLPDGRIQKVTYTAGKHGYNAHVTYDGYAHHDKGHGGHGHAQAGYH